VRLLCAESGRSCGVDRGGTALPGDSRTSWVDLLRECLPRLARRNDAHCGVPAQGELQPLAPPVVTELPRLRAGLRDVEEKARTVAVRIVPDARLPRNPSILEAVRRPDLLGPISLK
jgi:hypothetical protein